MTIPTTTTVGLTLPRVGNDCPERETDRQGGRSGEGAERAEGARLGSKATKEQQEVTADDLRRRLWALHRTMWDVTDFARLRGCHRWIADGAGAASLRWHEPGRASWGNLQTSASVWASPLSAASISKTRAEEVTTALETWFNQDKQHGVEFVTLTLAHNRDQEVAEVWDTLSYAWRGVVATASWRGGKRCEGDKKTFGVAHWLKTVEVTHGENGWHCHLHVLLFVERELSSAQRQELEGNIYARWSRAAQRKGFKAPSRAHGVRVEKALREKSAEQLGAYMAKGSLMSVAETLAWEMTAGQTAKEGRGKDHRTPFQILDDIRKSGDTSGNNPDVQLWRIWERGSLGRRQQAWSKGAKDALGLVEISDEEAEAQAEESTSAVEVARVSFDEWGRTRDEGKKLRDDLEKRGDIVQYVGQSRTPEEAHRRARSVLAAYGIEHDQDEKPVPIERVAPVVLPVNRDQAREPLAV